MLKNKKIYVIPIFGFLAMILVTTLLLKFPICNQQNISYIDAFFEAASMITATGSNVVTLSDQFTFLGQLVCLVAMQVRRHWLYAVFLAYFYHEQRKNEAVR